MVANNFITKLEHSPRNRNNDQLTRIDVTYNVLPKKNEDNFIEPPYMSTRKRLRSRDSDDVSSPGKYLITIQYFNSFTIYCFL